MRGRGVLREKVQCGEAHRVGRVWERGLATRARVRLRDRATGKGPLLVILEAYLMVGVRGEGAQLHQARLARRQRAPRRSLYARGGGAVSTIDGDRIGMSEHGGSRARHGRAPRRRGNGGGGGRAAPSFMTGWSSMRGHGHDDATEVPIRETAQDGLDEGEGESEGKVRVGVITSRRGRRGGTRVMVRARVGSE